MQPLPPGELSAVIDTKQRTYIETSYVMRTKIIFNKCKTFFDKTK